MVKSIVDTEKNGVRSINRFYSPPSSLRNFIRYFWCIEISEEHESNKLVDVAGSRFPRLTFQHLDNGNAMTEINGKPMARSWIKGLASGHKKFNMYGRYAHTGVSFQPIGLKVFFGIDASVFTNQWIDLCEFEEPVLGERLYLSKVEEQRIAILCRYFEEKLRQNLKYDSGLLSSIILNEFSPSEHGVYLISKKLKISERQLERKFQSHIGVSPRKYLKLKRFESAYKLLLTSRDMSFSNIAFQLDYSDQSHFIREFKELSGITPGQFRERNILAEEGSAFLQVPK